MKKLIPARIPPACTLTLVWLAITATLLAVWLLTLRAQLTGMMASPTQDTATLMAVALAPHANEDSALYRDTLLKGLAESGDYAEVTFTAVNNKQTGLHLPRYLPDVPTWFQQLLAFEPPVAQAEVRAGWDLAGHITVSRQPGTGYRLLWYTALAVSGLSLTGLALALWWQARSQAQQVRQQREQDDLRRELEQTLELLQKRAESMPKISPAEARVRLIGPLRSPKQPEEVDL